MWYTIAVHPFHSKSCLFACRNLYETELSLLVDPDYLHNHGPDHQPKMYIDQSMRMIVISWLVEVACEYELHQETLFLSAALLDRFMSLSKVNCPPSSFSKFKAIPFTPFMRSAGRLYILHDN